MLLKLCYNIWLNLILHPLIQLIFFFVSLFSTTSFFSLALAVIPDEMLNSLRLS